MYIYKIELLVINDNVCIRAICFNKAHIIVVIITLTIKEWSNWCSFHQLTSISNGERLWYKWRLFIIYYFSTIFLPSTSTMLPKIPYKHAFNTYREWSNKLSWSLKAGNSIAWGERGIRSVWGELLLLLPLFDVAVAEVSSNSLSVVSEMVVVSLATGEVVVVVLPEEGAEWLSELSAMREERVDREDLEEEERLSFSPWLLLVFWLRSWELSLPFFRLKDNSAREVV